MAQIKNLLLTLFVAFFSVCLAQENTFIGRVNADNVNIRSDSTVSSEMICKVSKNNRLQIVSESYDWYKVRLPIYAPSYVKKDLVGPIDEQSARVIKDNVNIRLKGNDASPILGKASHGEIVKILREKEEWLKIEPVHNSFGWIHKKFIDKVPLADKTSQPQPTRETQAISQQDNVIIEGTIYPKVIKRVASHKLVAGENKLFLLRGNREELNFFNRRKVKVTGKLIASGSKDGLPVLEIEKIEALEKD